MKVHFEIDCCDICYSYLDGFRDNNLQFTTIEDADIICFIGCGYTQSRIFQTYEKLLNCLQRKKDGSKIGVFGCPTNYSKFYEAIKNIPDIDFIAKGTGKKMQDDISSYLESHLKQEIELLEIGCNLENPKRINIVVQDGCNNRCAFCKSNYLNLKLESRPIEDILKIVKFASEELHVNEVNISGLNPTQYGMDIYKSKKLTELIQSISLFGGVDTIFLDMLCVQDMTSELVKEIVTNPKIKRVMIPIQSQDDRLLKLMNRHNTAQEAENLFKFINRERPDIFLETIFLTCYPTETKDNILKTAEFLNTVNISNPNLSFYRYGTNEPTLKSENIAVMTQQEIQELANYYLEIVVPIIEQQRKALMSKPISGILINRDKKYDYYSTIYRFATEEYKIRTKRNKNKDIYNHSTIKAKYLPSKKGALYKVAGDITDGKVIE